ncbi:hypothetical protein PEBR_40975 [Penicillium brasilianum]|uniref:Uncharacterized protein n=1 Tax=Penicillium brasilianum TaxID=104259 RepID=A0A1S9R958_PENBI|nr:hypothetical protein PEBR_40975 [Penicillium brasilianum]
MIKAGLDCGPQAYLEGMRSCSIPSQVNAFVLNEPVCAGKYARIAPFSLPDYGTLGPGTRLEHDVIPHLDLRTAAPASINSRLADLVSGTPRRDRMGIYLHWTVPKPFRASVASSNSASKQHNEKRDQRGVPEGSDFLAVPDRWVIIRRLIQSTSAPRDMSRLCAFVVESNRVRRLDRDELDQLDLDTEAAPFIDHDSGTHAQHGVLLGAKYPLQGWAEVPENQYHSPLTIADAANPLFADFQHHFGFHADSQHDPLAASKADSNRALLESHRMALPKPAVTNTTDVSENPWLDGAPSKKHRVRSLCHGIVSPLYWSQKELPGRVPADEAAQHFTRQQPIAIGTDLIDALTTSVTAPADPSAADPAQAEAFKHLETLATDPGDDGQETSTAAQTRSNQFKPVPGGHIWTWNKPAADIVKHGVPEAGSPAPVAKPTEVQASGSQATAALVALGTVAPSEQPPATTPFTTPPTAFVGSPASSAKPTQVPTSPDTNTELQLPQLNATQVLYDSALRYSALLQHQLFCEWWKARAAGFGDPGEEDSETLPDDGFESMQRWYIANLPATRSRVRDILTKLYVLQHRGDAADTSNGSLLNGLAHQLEEPKLTTAHKMPSERFFSASDPTVLLRGLESSWPEEFTKDTMEVELNTDLLNPPVREAATAKEEDGNDDD